MTTKDFYNIMICLGFLVAVIASTIAGFKTSSVLGWSVLFVWGILIAFGASSAAKDKNE